MSAPLFGLMQDDFPLTLHHIRRRGCVDDDAGSPDGREESGRGVGGVRDHPDAHEAGGLLPGLRGLHAGALQTPSRLDERLRGVHHDQRTLDVHNRIMTPP